MPLLPNRARRAHFPASEEVTSHYGMDPTIYPLVRWMVIGWAAGIVCAVSAVMAVYPAVKASRLHPVEALRHT